MKAQEDRISGWQKALVDYENLEKTLGPLPQELSRQVMVPFGKLAFFPGKIIHTNELTVLLGDDWFADRTVPQTLEILERRKKTVRENIKNAEDKGVKLKKQLEIIQNLLQDAEDVVEIVEQYDDNANLISSNLPTFVQPGSGRRQASVEEKSSKSGKNGKGKAKEKSNEKREPLIDFDSLLAKIGDLEKQEAGEEEKERGKPVRERQAEPLEGQAARVKGSSGATLPSEKEPLRSTSQPIPIPARSGKNERSQQQQQQAPSTASRSEIHEGAEIRTPSDIYQHMLRLTQKQTESQQHPDRTISPTKQGSVKEEFLPVPHLADGDQIVSPGSPKAHEDNGGQIRRRVSFHEDNKGEVAKEVKVFKAGSTIGLKKGRLASEDGEHKSILKLASPSVDSATAPNPLEQQVAKTPVLTPGVADKKKPKGSPIRMPGVQADVAERSVNLSPHDPQPSAEDMPIVEFDDSMVDDENIVDLDQVTSSSCFLHYPWRLTQIFLLLFNFPFCLFPPG